MTKFKVGDKFIPRMTKTNAAEWNRHMKLHDGETLIVEQITTDGYIRPKDFGVCLFHPDWCEKVEENQSVETNEMVAENHIPEVRKMVDSSEISNNQEHIVEANKMIDWEQRRYELAKDFMAAIITGLITTKADWVDVGKVGSPIDLADEMIKQLKEQ